MVAAFLGILDRAELGKLEWDDTKYSLAPTSAIAASCDGVIRAYRILQDLLSAPCNSLTISMSS